MKQSFLNHSINFITKNHPNYTADDIEKLSYGLEGIYLTITKIIIIIALSLLLNILKETLFLLLLVNLIRFTGFGFHAGKSLDCLIFSGLLFLGFPLLSKNITIPVYIQIMICIVCVIVFLIYAPADTEKRPLTNKKKRIVRKIGTLLISFAYIVAVVLIKKPIYSNLFLFSLIIEGVMILPITYRVFHQPYANYKKN